MTWYQWPLGIKIGMSVIGGRYFGDVFQLFRSTSRNLFAVKKSRTIYQSVFKLELRDTLRSELNHWWERSALGNGISVYQMFTSPRTTTFL